MYKQHRQDCYNNLIINAMIVNLFYFSPCHTTKYSIYGNSQQTRTNILTFELTVDNNFFNVIIIRPFKFGVLFQGP